MIEKLIGFFKQGNLSSFATRTHLRPHFQCKGSIEIMYSYPNCCIVNTIIKTSSLQTRTRLGNNHEANYAFIQDFVVTHLNGIKLVKGNSGFRCPACKLVIPVDKTQATNK